MKLVILASGRGSRLNSLTKDIPKCMVSVSGKPIIKYLEKSFKLFKEIIIVTGYKSSKIEKKDFKKSVKFIKNNNYKNTNMVYSLFCASKKIDQDIVIAYSDIIVDHKIFIKLINKKTSTVPLNYNWLKNWKQRMKMKDIYNDAEDVTLKGNKLSSIGKTITYGKLPKFQFMGILKLTYNDFLKLEKFFYKIKKPKIDFTSFIDLSIKNKVIEIGYMKSGFFWTEIDSVNDLKIANKLIKGITTKL